MDRLYFVRHGENLANLTKEFSYKKVDYPLTAKGVLQAQQTADYFLGKPVGRIFSSPLKRCTQTAAIIANRFDLPVLVEEDLREVNVGSLEGQPVSQGLWDAHNVIIQAWCAGNSEASFPGGENQLQLANRFGEVLRRILEAGHGTHTIILGHGGLFTFGLPLLCRSLKLEALIQIPNHNCSITTLDLSWDSSHFSGYLQQWAQIDHLYGTAADFVHGVPRAGELPA